MAEDKETRERVRELVRQVLAAVPAEEEDPPAENFPQRVVVNSLQDKTGKEFDRDESIRTLREIPMDLVEWTVKNSHRQDVPVDPMSDPKIRDAVAQATFEHLVGFQLTDEQLRYNATR